MKVLVAVIAYNEELNIESTLDDLIAYRKEAPFPYDIVVIDNGSQDRTACLAREKGVPVVSHCVNSGGSGGTITTYFGYASFHGYDVLAQFDGDGQHLADQLPEIIQPILDQQADYVIGSRYLKAGGFKSTALRRIGIRIFNDIASLLTRITITDSTSGARAYGHHVIEFFGKKYQHQILDPIELLLLSHYAGARVLEVPVVMKEREHGQSEFTSLSSVLFMVRGMINVLSSFLQRGIVQRVAGG